MQLKYFLIPLTLLFFGNNAIAKPTDSETGTLYQPFVTVAEGANCPEGSSIPQEKLYNLLKGEMLTLVGGKQKFQLKDAPGHRNFVEAELEKNIGNIGEWSRKKRTRTPFELEGIKRALL